MTSTRSDSDRHLDPPLRVLLGVGAVLARIGLLPTAVSEATKPLAQRQAGKPQAWQSRRARRDVEVSHASIESRGGPLRIRIYTPPGTHAGDPAVLYIHGGGFIVGGLDSCHWICAELAGRTGRLVASVEYRLAPDDKFPAALEDCFDALEWLAAGGPSASPPRAIAVAGDSAGGNLSAALCILARDTAGPAIAHQTLIYPVLDSTLNSASWRKCAGAGLDLEVGRQMFVLYAGDHPWDDPLVSPVHADDLGRLAPAYIALADWDVLHDDGVAYAARLEAAGIRATVSTYRGMPHGFLSLNRLCRLATAAVGDISGAIADALR